MLEFVGYKRQEEEPQSTWTSLGESFFTKNTINPTSASNSDDSEDGFDPGVDPSLMGTKHPSRKYERSNKGSHTSTSEDKGNEAHPPTQQTQAVTPSNEHASEGTEQDFTRSDGNGCPTEERFGSVAGAGPGTSSVFRSRDELQTADAKSLQDPFIQDSTQKRKTVHLVFCIHGIGQKLAEDFTSLDFSHDVERLQDLCRRQMNDENVRSFIGSGQIKFIPVSWRRLLNFDPHNKDYQLKDLMLESNMYVRANPTCGSFFYRKSSLGYSILLFAAPCRDRENCNKGTQSPLSLVHAA